MNTRKSQTWVIISQFVAIAFLGLYAYSKNQDVVEARREVEYSKEMVYKARIRMEEARSASHEQKTKYDSLLKATRSMSD